MNFEGIKEAATGRCGEIISALTPLPADVIEKRGKDQHSAVLTQDEIQGALDRAAEHRDAVLRGDSKPPRCELVVANIPNEIRQLRRWVCWRWNRNRGKWTKVPVRPDGTPASSTTETTWSTFDDCVRAFESRLEFAGIGFVLGGGYAGVDLDSVYDPHFDEADSIVHEVTERLDSYTEISPSGCGLKILVRGSLPRGRRQSASESTYDVECYDTGRYFTITGQRWPDTPPEIHERSEALAWFHRAYVAGPTNRQKLSDFSFDDYVHDQDTRKAAEAIEHIPAGYADIYEDWVRVGMAAKKVGDTLLDNWIAWSSKASAEKFQGPEDCRAKWNQLPSDPEVGLGTLIHLAKESGWSPSWSTNESRNRLQAANTEQSPRGWNAAQLVAEFPDRRAPIIDGVIRQGEVMNIIGAPKQGKSWFIYYLCLSIASGRDWFGKGVDQGRVLLLDNELHPNELAYRIKSVAGAMSLDLSDIGKSFIVESLRGDHYGIGDIQTRIAEGYADDEFTLIAIDAFYRILPAGISENDNASMTQVYNQIDTIAARARCAITLNHHTSKGDQSQKAVTDVGAGAGAMTRATDTHVIMRPHELESCVVMEATCRSFPPIRPSTLCFDWPLWSLKLIDPVLKQPKGSSKEEQAERDKEADTAILDALKGGSLTRRQIQTEAGMGEARTNRAISRLKKAKKVESKKAKKKTGRRCEVFFLSAVLSAKKSVRT